MTKKLIGSWKLWRLILIALFAVGVMYQAGCEYTIQGNPDVNLVEARLSPQDVLMTAGSTLHLTAAIAGAMNDNSYSWSISGDTASHLTTNGFNATYTAPDSATTDPMVVTITVTSNEDPSHFGRCTVKVINASFNSGEVDIAPLLATMLTTNSLQLEAKVTGVTTPVIWSLVSGPGSVTSSGLYMPPSSATDNTQVTIQATSAADTTEFAQCYITLINGTDSLKCFSSDVQPILTASCGISGCHAANDRESDLTTYDGVLKEVTPGNARGSRLYQVITELNRNQRMPPPPYPTLSPSQVATIGKWIDEGASNSTCN